MARGMWLESGAPAFGSPPKTPELSGRRRWTERSNSQEGEGEEEGKAALEAVEPEEAAWVAMAVARVEAVE